MIFTRENQKFSFPANSDKKKKEMIAEAVAGNQLFFAIACVMNYQPCISAMKWFRESVSFSKDYGDIPKQLLEYAEDSNMLQAIVSYAKQADVGIEDMTFEVSNEELSQSKLLFENIPEGILRALKEFAAALKDSSDTAEMNLRVGGGGIKNIVSAQRHQKRWADGYFFSGTGRRVGWHQAFDGTGTRN
uniref:hypothetical protein n=1 Tax=Enterocloster clostridioformis TaxID=1531 RepID=UPI002675BC59|nr:hypothetical protein [Enterocloster clostridioformis]